MYAKRAEKEDRPCKHGEHRGQTRHTDLPVGVIVGGQIVLTRQMDEHHAALPEPDRNRLTGCQAAEDIALRDLGTLAAELVVTIDNHATISSEPWVDVRPGDTAT